MTTRACSSCGSSSPKASYSKKQWKAGDGKRRCKSCTSSGITPGVSPRKAQAKELEPTESVAERGSAAGAPSAAREEPLPAAVERSPTPPSEPAQLDSPPVQSPPAAAAGAAAAGTAPGDSVPASVVAALRTEHAAVVERLVAEHAAELDALRAEHVTTLERSARAVRAVVKADEARRRDRGLEQLLGTVAALEQEAK